MKQRFSSLDIKIIAHELSQSLVSLRVSNIYDLSSRIFLFKFAKPDHRQQLVVDSGFRCHLSSFARTTAAEPTPFVSRLRKFLKTRRVTAVKQVGTDRILELQFSDGQYHLYYEFYAGGNIILTDNELKVLALFRTVTDGAEHEHIRAGSTYNLTKRQNINGTPPLTLDRVKAGLERHVGQQAEGDQAQGRKFKKKAGDKLRKALAACINEFPPILLDHALRTTDFDITLDPAEVLKDETLLQKVLEALEVAARTVETITSAEVSRGYIIGKQRQGQEENHEDNNENTIKPAKDIMYNDFQPFRPKQLEDDPENVILEFEGFNKTVDQFFSSIEGQKLESRLQEREDNARKKIEHAKQDQQKRIDGLLQVQEINVRRAQAIEANLERVEEARAAINGLVAQGMDWVEIDRLIEMEQKRKNPVAEIIKIPLKLFENTASLMLDEWEVDQEDDEDDLTESEPSDSEDEQAKQRPAKAQPTKPTDKRLNVEIDLAVSAWSNAREYYDQKKTAAAKEEKTVQASTKALKSAQQKIEADLKRGLKQEKDTLRPVRQPFWFEKFTYFVSSDGYLVVGGKDRLQSESIFLRHFKKGDVFVHADLDGAIPMFIKNNASTPDAPIPPSTLSQAGHLCVCTSTAWDSKAVMSAWWATKSQVKKKSAHTGDYLTPGRFELAGEKNFLPPAQLLLGFAVLFQISDASKAKHTKHRIQDERMPPESQPASKDSHAEQSENSEAEESTDDQTREDEDAAAHDEVENDSHAEADEDEDSNAASDSDHNSKHDEIEPGAYENPLQLRSRAQHETNEAEQNKEQDDTRDPLANLTSTKEAEKSQDQEHDRDSGSDSDSDSDTTSAIPTPSTSTPSTQTSKSSKPPRGKRAQARRAAKYASQDPADRAAAQALLGSGAGLAKARAASEAAAVAAAENAAQRARRREAAERSAARMREREERALDAHEEEEEESGPGVDLDALVGRPMVGDEILEAVPVCAPWSALGRYKYKVKLQPGAMKKGKAVREILGKWGLAAKGKAVDEKSEDVERMWPREVDLIKAWKEAEVLGVVPVGKVRVMMSGGSDGSKGSGGGKGKGRGGRGSKKR